MVLANGELGEAQQLGGLGGRVVVPHRLPARERTILALRFVRGMSQSQIAAEVGVSQMHVSRLIARSLTVLREGLNEEV